MKFYFDVANEIVEMKFGQQICGLQKKGRRPLVCYLSINEIVHPVNSKYLAAYLNTLRKSLHPVDGKIEIR